jgi:hypothetical protein
MKLAACLLLLATPAAADVFDIATGRWGLADVPELSCAENPHDVSFSADRSRARFRWTGPMLNYEGDWDEEGTYTVLARGADHLVLALDGESRRSRSGAPVVWIMRLLDDGARYCWGRTDWDAADCVDRYIRCPAPEPTS